MRSSGLVLLVVALVATGAGAEGAAAATVSATVTHGYDAGVPEKGVPPSVTTASTLQVTAPSGEANAMTLRAAGTDVVELEDTGVPPRAGPGCTPAGAGVVRCAVGGRLTVNATLGDGNDTWDSGAVDARVNGGAGDDRLRAAGRIVGGSGDDVLTAALPPSFVTAQTVLDGGAGADRMSGGLASYAGRKEAVTVDLADAGTDGAPGEGDVIENATGAIGGGGDDVLLGSDGPDALYGGSGADRIDARAGDDIADGGRPPSNIPVGGQADGAPPTPDRQEQVVGGPGNDEVAGTGELDGGDGDDVVRGDGTLSGGEGNDIVRAGAPGAIADGGPGNDSVAEEAPGDMAPSGLGTGPIGLAGGPGDDAVGPGSVGAIPARLDGGDGNDVLWAGNVGDRGDAGPGNDTVRLVFGDTAGRVSCGAGTDLAEPSGQTNPAPRSCERVRPFFGAEGDRITFPRRPAIAHGVARFRFAQTCGGLLSVGVVDKCLVRVELRTMRGALIGLASVRLHGGGATTVRVALRHGLADRRMAIHLHILGSDRTARQEALNGGWVA